MDSDAHRACLFQPRPAATRVDARTSDEGWPRAPTPGGLGAARGARDSPPAECVGPPRQFPCAGLQQCRTVHLTPTAADRALRRWPCAIWSRRQSDWPAISYRPHMRRFFAVGWQRAISRPRPRDGQGSLAPVADYRPRVVMVVTDVFMSLTGNGDRGAETDARAGPVASARVRCRPGIIRARPQRSPLTASREVGR